MSNRPIPRKGLLGCWFLDDRGIAYNAGTNEAKDRSGRGNHATYKNGVTVGVEGDPAREFGASDFDASSNQFADVGKSLAVDGAQATVAIFKVETLSATDNTDVAGNAGFSSGTVLEVKREFDVLSWQVADGSGNLSVVEKIITEQQYYAVVGAWDGDSTQSLYTDGKLEESTSLSTHTVGNPNFAIGNRVTSSSRYFDGEIAAVGRYDLTVPDAPEPSEIARKWDKLRDIPATR